MTDKEGDVKRELDLVEEDDEFEEFQQESMLFVFSALRVCSLGRGPGRGE